MHSAGSPRLSLGERQENDNEAVTVLTVRFHLHRLEQTSSQDASERPERL